MARSLLSDTLWRVGLLAAAALLLVWLAVSAALRTLGRLSEEVEQPNRTTCGRCRCLTCSRRSNRWWPR